MNWCPCYGRECKLGWGWNQSLDLLIPVQGQPLNVTSEAADLQVYCAFNLSSDILLYWASFLFIIKFSMNILVPYKFLSGTELQTVP